MGSVVIGDQRSLDGFGGGPVVPDGGGHGEQPLGDAGVDAGGGAAAVAFQVELAFEGVVDRFDPLAVPADAPGGGGTHPMGPGRGSSSRRSGRTRSSPNPLVTRSSNSRPAKPLSPIRVSPGRRAWLRAAWASSSAATSRSPIAGLARHQATGIPSGVVIRYSFKPQYQREWAAQYP